MKKLILLILGIIYYLTIHVYIVDLKDTHTKNHFFTFSIKSHIAQVVNLHIGTNKYKIPTIKCDRNNRVMFNNKRRLWFEKNAGEEVISVEVKKGITTCIARVKNTGRYYTAMVNQKITLWDYIVLFVLLGLPLITYLIQGMTFGLNKLKDKMNVFIPPSESNISIKLSLGILILLSLGFLLRGLFFYRYGVYNFQHDWLGHVEFIRYMSSHWEMPQVSKGLQFPQQPLYYIITGGLYSLFIEFKINSNQAIYYIGYFSLLCSFIFLYYGARFFMLIAKSRWVQIVAMSFIVFTPSLVYMSTRINNDVLVLALSTFSLYYIVKSYLSSFEKSFYHALIGTSLLFMTKISAAPIELLFFSLLIIVYMNKNSPSNIKKRLFIFSTVGIFLLGMTLLRVYLPVENTFHMVNSSGHFPNQHIPALDFSFFTYLNLDQLLTIEYQETYMKDTSLYTFPNHQYRTMLLGEFNYTKYLNNIGGLKINIQVIFLLALIYIIGFFTYILSFKSVKILDKLLMVTLIFNLLLILKFVFDYPSICNTDFRYFGPSFLLLSYVFARGLEYVSVNIWIRNIVSFILILLAIGEIWFLILLSEYSI